MAKSKKSHEQSRQAKIMRQRARARERQRATVTKEAVDEFQMFRTDLLPPDVDAAEWTRTRILEDLNGLRPSQALPQFIATFTDPSTLEEDEEGMSQIEWSLFLWQLALLEPGEREEAIRKSATSVAEGAERQEQFRDFATEVVRTHEEMFPRLHARVARARGKPRTDLPEESILTDLPLSEEEIEALADARAAAAGLPPANRFLEYAQPLVTAAGQDRMALERAFTLASIFWAAAALPLEERAGFLAYERDRQETEEERARFDESASMMLRRYRELFASTPEEPPHDAATAATSEAIPPAEPPRAVGGPRRDVGEIGDERRPRGEAGEPAPGEKSAERGEPVAATEGKPSLLGRLFRRSGQ
jgi:hypothetical protein